MIERLLVRDLAVIEAVELEFGPGLNVLTGETGAGKSILLAALRLLCGRRLASETVRSGADEARVEAVVSSTQIVAEARARGLAAEADCELLLVRTLAREGKSRAWVNGGVATLRLLEELGAQLIEFTAQGEHQELMRPEVQTELVDAMGGHGALLERVQAAHAGLARSLREQAQSERTSAERARREDLLRFEIEQLERVGLRRGELGELEAEHARLAHVDRLVEAVQAALLEVDGEDGASAQVARAARSVRDASALDATLLDGVQALERAQIELEEARFALARYGERLEADPEQLVRVEARLAELRRLELRYGAGEDALLGHLERARLELEGVADDEARRKALALEVQEAERALESAAHELSKARRAAARELEAGVAKELEGLGLARAAFEARVEPLARKSEDGRALPSGPRGREAVAFWLAANPGEPARPLREAASGGERARVLLAIKAALRESEAPRTLVFDEIDAGIGGRTAQRVAERLQSLAERHQVLAITHLPQIAACADVHYRVIKETRARRTRTHVEKLAGDARIEEIARMAGGTPSDAARAHARELLETRRTR